MIYKVVGGFWSHPNHFQELFEYLTKVPSLLENIKHRLRSETELMEEKPSASRKVNFISIYQNS